MIPETRYAKTQDGLHIAYKAIGEGPIDLVYTPAFVNHVEVIWEEPLVVRFLERLASFSRLIHFDKRGTGLSDPVPETALPTLEQRMDDLRAVMDAVGSERAALLGASEGGPMCILFAATHPERTSALVLFSTFPRAIQDEDFPEGWLPAEQVGADLELIERMWTAGTFQEYFEEYLAEGLTPEELERVGRWFARLCRMSVSPGGVVSLSHMSYDLDVRHVLPSITAPTLCLVRAGDENAPATRYIAEHVHDAKYVELPGSSHMPEIGEQEQIIAEIQEFLTGIRPAPEPDRVLATVLFTDVVASTERAAAMGDRAWTDLIGIHHVRVRHELERFRGREVDTAGDGLFATFDGPARAIRCAGAIVDSARGLGISLRAGLHTGECELAGDKVRGIAVHTGARVAALAGPGEVLVSSTVKDLVAGSGLRFEDRGEHELKGVPGEWRLYAVVGN